MVRIYTKRPKQIELKIWTLLVLDELLLNAPEKYHYLKQSGCYGDPSINDVEDFNNVLVWIILNASFYPSFYNSISCLNAKPGMYIIITMFFIDAYWLSNEVEIVI